MFDSITSELTKKDPVSPRNDKEKERISLDKIIFDYGYGLEVWKIIICTILVYLMVGYSTTIFATLLTAYTTYFNLSDGEISFLGCIFFIFRGVGALFVGYLTILFRNRLILIYTCCSFFLITTILLALTMNINILFVERIFSGIATGVLEALVNNLLCEFLPVYLRGFTLLIVFTGYSLGQLFPNLIMLATMPNYDPKGIPKTLFICSTMFIISIIVFLFILEDSPRNYILNGEDQKAFKILEKMKEGEIFTEREKRSVIRGVKDGVNGEASTVSLWEIFKPQYVTLTIYISILALIVDLIFDGPVLIMTLTLSTLEKNKPAVRMLRDNIIVILFSLPSCLIGGILMEIKFLGRKKTIFISFIGLGITTIFALIFREKM